MKKAFIQVLALLIFANGVMMISTYTQEVPQGYLEGKALVSYSPSWQDEGLLVNVGDKSIFSVGGASIYLTLDVGDSVNVHYKINQSRDVILDVYITDWKLVPFTIDKLVLQFFASLFLFGLLTRKNRGNDIN